MSLSFARSVGLSAKASATIRSRSSAVAGSRVSLAFSASARNAASFRVSWNALRKVRTRSFGVPGGSASGRANAAAFWMPTLISWRASSVFARPGASGTPARSGNARELVWSTATTSPESSAARQVDRIDSQGPARAAQLAGRRGQPDLGRPLVARDELDRQPERGLQDTGVGVRRAAELHRRLGGHPLVDRRDPAPASQRADRVFLDWSADQLELPHVELDAGLTE